MQKLTLKHVEALRLIARTGQSDELIVVKELINRELIHPCSDNPPMYSVSNKGICFLNAHGERIDPKHVTRARVSRTGLARIYGNPHADKRTD